MGPLVEPPFRPPPSIDFKAVIELVKYTLALTAACVVYSLEKLSPQITPGGPWSVLGLLATFALAACCGVFIFSSATSALHGDDERAKRQERRIEIAATAHGILLLVGIVALAGLLGYRVWSDEPKPAQICCETPKSSSSPQ